MPIPTIGEMVYNIRPAQRDRKVFFETTHPAFVYGVVVQYGAASILERYTNKEGQLCAIMCMYVAPVRDFSKALDSLIVLNGVDNPPDPDHNAPVKSTGQKKEGAFAVVNPLGTNDYFVASRAPVSDILEEYGEVRDEEGIESHPFCYRLTVFGSEDRIQERVETRLSQVRDEIRAIQEKWSW